MNIITLVIILPLMIVMFGFLIYYMKQRTTQLHVQLDGRLTELLSVTKALAHAQGLAEGRELEKASRTEKENVG